MPGLMVFERGGGTYMYSPLHIMWLASAAALCLWSALMARRHGRAACRAVGMTLLCAESARVLALYIGGKLDCGLRLHVPRGARRRDHRRAHILVLRARRSLGAAVPRLARLSADEHIVSQLVRHTHAHLRLLLRDARLRRPQAVGAAPAALPRGTSRIRGGRPVLRQGVRHELPVPHGGPGGLAARVAGRVLPVARDGVYPAGGRGLVRAVSAAGAGENGNRRLLGAPSHE